MLVSPRLRRMRPALVCPQGLLGEGIQVGLGDGSVRFVSDSITPATFYAACTPNSNDVLGADW